jgi:hypothetical protein
MGKIGRFACILTPLLLTLAGLICIVIVMIGQLSTKDNKAPSTALGRDLYFFKVRQAAQHACAYPDSHSAQADTSGFTADPDNVLDHLPDSVKIDDKLTEALKGAASSKDLKDFYQVGLWSYCAGDKDEKTGKETITYCSASKTNFWFDPISVWELKDTSAQKLFGDDVQKGLDTYKKVSGWMVWSFGIALILSAAEFIIGFFAIFSRWGSLVTTIVSTVRAFHSHHIVAVC